MSDKEEYPRGFIVFTGPYEVHYTMNDAENRVEDLLDEGHNKPTIISVELSQEGGTEPLGMTAHKFLDVARQGEIR